MNVWENWNEVKWKEGCGSVFGYWKGGRKGRGSVK